MITSKRNLLFIVTLSLLGLFLSVSSCKTTQSTLKVSNSLKATKVLTLQMPKDEDGHNGAGVAFHSGNNQWYAVFAGNVYFPLAVFDKTGKLIKCSTAQYDARGFWYNEGKKSLEGNGYSDQGIIKINLDSKGIPEGYDEIFSGSSHQPYANSVGAYDPKNDEILYFYDGEIQRYDRKNGQKIATMGLKEDLSPYDLNETTVVYTGYKGGELGLLDYKSRKVILIDKGSGRKTGSIALPKDAPIEGSFNFAFSGGHLWLFDIENRKWCGYAVK